MSAFRFLLLTTFASLLGSAQGQTLHDGRITREGFVPLDHPEMYDGTSIVTALEPARARRLLGGRRWFAVQRARVEDSRAFARGSVVEVYQNFWSQERYVSPDDYSDALIGQAGALPVGARALVVGARSDGTFLRTPDLNKDSPQEVRLERGAGGLPAVYAFVVFDTTRTVLPPLSDPMWRALQAVAEAIPGTSDANVIRVADFLETVRLPEWNDISANSKTDDRLSSLFSGAVAKQRPYHRALIDLALNKLYYVGYGDRYYHDLYASANDPAAFPDGVGRAWWFELPGVDDSLPKGFRHDASPTQAQFLAILRTAKSPTVAAYILEDLPKPSDADAKSLARLLDSPDPRLRFAFVKRLAAWYGAGAPEEPRPELVDGVVRLVYPGLNDLVAAWKARLAKL